MSADDNTSPEKAFDEALNRKEIALQLEADKRLADVKAEAAANPKAAGEADKPVNPDG